MEPFRLRMSNALIISLFLIGMFSVANADSDVTEEARGKKKKKKLALFIFIADLVIKKIFILKLAYAFVFWVFIHKAGYFLGWFLTYLKEKKHDHIHIEHDHDHEHYIPHSSWGSYDSGHDSSFSSYGPYRRQAHLQQP